MAKKKAPATAATRALKSAGIEFDAHVYKYEEKGGTSPFGTRKELPVYMEETIAQLPLIYINGGKRGLLVSMSAADTVRLLEPVRVSVSL